MKRHHLTIVATVLSTLPLAAAAYVGPGAGLGLLGALWALIAALGAALMFVLLWPVRRLLLRRKLRAQQIDAANPSNPGMADPAARPASRRPGEH